MPCTPTRSTVLAIDNDGDLVNDIAFSYVFSEPARRQADRQRLPGGRRRAESAEAVGEKIFSDVPVSFVGDEPHIATSGDFTFSAGARSDAFFFDFDGIKNLFDTSRQAQLHRTCTLPGESPWTGVDSNTKANVFSTAIEMPTGFLGADPISGSGAGAACGRRQTAPRGPGRAPVGEQLLQHRRHQGGVQRQRARQRPGPVDRPVRPSAWATPAATRARRPSPPSTTRAHCRTC